MVGGMLRHLNSLRRMKRDNGWIETLLEESYNERMHLLTFMKMCEPGRFMKLMIIGAQGVFFNSLFIAYLLSPRVVHRFVGYLEEEAVHTYTRAIHEIDEGHLPKWTDANFRIPDIAIEVSERASERSRARARGPALSAPFFSGPGDGLDGPADLWRRLAVLEHARGGPHDERPHPLHSRRRGRPPRRQPHARQPQPEGGPEPVCQYL